VATAERPPATGRPADTAPRRSDRHPVNWLLAVPVVLALLTPLYNKVEPRLFGWPLFYWLQLSFVIVGVAATSTVYLVTRRSPEEREASRRAAAGEPVHDEPHARDGGAHR
jgi:hypothetical protein